MTDLEKNLSKVLDEHRHESGLHMIGGERRLIHRLVEFFEHAAKPEDSQPASDLGN